MTVSLKLEQLTLDPACQPRTHIDQRKATEYSHVLKGGGEFPPVEAIFDGQQYWLYDGWHRWHAHRKAKITEIPCHVFQGTLRDAQLLAAGCNAEHGLQRTNADKERAVLCLLNDPDWREWSDHEIARRTKTSHTYVAKLRPVAQAEVNERKTSDGRRFPARKNGNVANAPAEEAPLTDHPTDAAEPEPEPKEKVPPMRSTAAGPKLLGKATALFVVEEIRKWLGTRTSLDSEEITALCASIDAAIAEWSGLKTGIRTFGRTGHSTPKASWKKKA